MAKLANSGTQGAEITVPTAGDFRVTVTGSARIMVEVKNADGAWIITGYCPATEDRQASAEMIGRAALDSSVYRWTTMSGTPTVTFEQ